MSIDTDGPELNCSVHMIGAHRKEKRRQLVATKVRKMLLLLQPLHCKEMFHSP